VSVRKPPVHAINAEVFSRTVNDSLYSDPSVQDMSLNEYVEFWTRTVTTAFDDLCPERQVSVTTRPPSRPWVTPHLKQLFNRRKNCHRIWLKQPENEQLRQRFRSARRESTLLNKRLRSQYFIQQFLDNRDNPRGHWRVLNTLLGRRPTRTIPPVETQQLTEVFSKQVLAPPSLADDSCLPHGPLSSTALTSFASISPSKVEMLLKDLNTWKSAGSDGIPPILMKSAAPELASSLADIFNESLATGCVPKLYKIANVCPVPKKGDASNPNNYRPVSLLPVASKILERIVYDQLQDHLSRQQPSCLPPQQHAYRKCHSCEDALAHGINNWQRALDRSEVVAVAVLDLSKAFDCVLHGHLLRDLFDCNVGGSALTWFRNYLADRTQQVRVPRLAAGASYPCSRGVPQGSVLGPCLFTLYTRFEYGCCHSHRHDPSGLYSSRGILPFKRSHVKCQQNKVYVNPEAQCCCRASFTSPTVCYYRTL